MSPWGKILPDRDSVITQVNDKVYACDLQLAHRMCYLDDVYMCTT